MSDSEKREEPERMTFQLEREHLLLALDGVMAQLMFMRSIISSGVPATAGDECQHPVDRIFETFAGERMCRDCGADLGVATESNEGQG